jgi:Ca2+-binding EF-hand superfamily protein
MELMLGWGTPAPPPPAPAKHELSAEQLEEIGALFKLYDEDMSGGISTRELKDAMRRTFLTETHIDEIFAKADSDDDKQLTLAEFQALMGSTGLWDSP